MQGACTQDNKYGYQDGTPCILLKVNRVRKSDCFLVSQRSSALERFINPNEIYHDEKILYDPITVLT